MLRDGADGVDLWAMAAELERQFAGYKQRLAERSSDAPDVVGADGSHGGGGDNGEEAAEDDAEAVGGGDVRGRMYEAYMRRRGERLREGWRARMERKEAEVNALWAQLERGGRAGERAPGGGGPTTDDGTAGEHKAEDDGEKRRSSDAAPSRTSGKKHACTRSFSSSTTKISRPDVGRRRALSQEPPPSEPPAGAADASRKDGHRARPTGAGMTAPKRKALSGNKSSAKEQGSLKPGPKPPRSLPRRSSSGGLENLKEAVLPNTYVTAPVQSCSSEQAAVIDETQKDSPPRPFARSGNNGTGIANARAVSPDSDCSEVVDSASDVEAEAKNVEKRNAEEIAVSPEKLANGEITSDSDTEPSYVYIKKDVIEEEAMRLSEALAGSDAKPELDGKKNEDNIAGETTAPSDAVAAESATTNTEEAPARESSDEPSFSGRSGGSPPNSPPSCSSRAQSIERLLEADAALIRKKREESAEKSVLMTPSSVRSRVSGAARSPKETVRGFKRFLSFGKKNRGREVTVIDCTSPSVPSLTDDDSASGGWQSTDSIKPRMGSSDAASEDMDHGYAVSPQACSLQSLVAVSPVKSELNEIVPQEKSPKAHRSFFSFRSLNCGRS